MLNKKLTLVVGGAVVASVAAFAVIAGTITAQRGDSDATSSAPVVEREISPLRSADGIFGTRDARVDRSPGHGDVSSKLARLVEAGEITQADADALTAWYDAKPDITIMGVGDKWVPAFWVYEASEEPEALAELVTEGIISQADSDALAAWASTRPDVDLPDFDGERGHGKDKGFWGAGLGDEDYDFAEDLTMLVDKGILTQADADALQAWLDSKPEIAFLDDYAVEDAHDYAEADADGETDLATELAEKVAAGSITQADADALLNWINAMPEVSVTFNGRAKAWLFDGEGDPEHEGFGMMFDALAEFGMITDAQAEEIRAWVDTMPDFSFNVGKIAKSMMAGDVDVDDSTEEEFDVNAMLAELVTKGVITQADSDALLTWWNAKPEIVATLMDSFAEMAEGGRGEHGRTGDHGRRGSGHGPRFSFGGASY